MGRVCMKLDMYGGREGGIAVQCVEEEVVVFVCMNDMGRVVWL